MMTSCPCCTDQLLRHISSQGIYWFCPSCRQEMPTLNKEGTKINLLEVNLNSSCKVTDFNLNKSRKVEKVSA
jgi:Zn finger protein HypA/HybF involved in hydrogenase expression